VRQQLCFKVHTHHLFAFSFFLFFPPFLLGFLGE